MNRLITFGCSHTFGAGVPDPDQQVWGKIVSNHLKLEFVNEGIRGSSNKLIAHQVRNFNFIPSDTVIILWSYLPRYGKLEDRYTYENFNPAKNTEISNTFYKHFYSDYDSKFTNKVFINYTLHYLLSLKIKFYFAGITYDTINSLTDINDYNLPIDFTQYQERYKMSAIDKHLNVTGNLLYGNNMTEKILEREYKSTIDLKFVTGSLL